MGDFGKRSTAFGSADGIAAAAAAAQTGGVGGGCGAGGAAGGGSTMTQVLGADGTLRVITPEMRSKFSGKTVVITGCSRGLGTSKRVMKYFITIIIKPEGKWVIFLFRQPIYRYMSSPRATTLALCNGRGVN